MAKKNESLTNVEKFYIENNPDKSDVDIAKELGRNVSLVTEHIHKVTPQGRVNQLLIRKKGCVVMTEGASMASDESRKGYVSDEAIQNAVNRQDFEEAARLQKIRQENLKRTEEAVRDSTSHYIHYIDKNRGRDGDSGLHSRR